LQSQVLQRLLGKKTLEAEILKEALEHATASKNSCGCRVAAEGRFAMKTVAEVIGVSRSNLIERMRERPKKRIGRPPLPDEKLVSGNTRVVSAVSNEATPLSSQATASPSMQRLEIHSGETRTISPLFPPISS
jgi:hypothetical protein